MSCALVLSIFIHFEDKKMNNILNMVQIQGNIKEENKIIYNVINSSDIDDKKSIKTQANSINSN